MKLTSEQKYHLLLEISHKIRDTLNPDEIMAHLLDTIQTVLPYDAAGIFVLTQNLIHDRRISSQNVIAGMCWRGYDPLPKADEMLTFGKGIIGHVITTGNSLVAPDVRLNEHYIEARKTTLSEIAVPILRHERALGALNLESDQLEAYDESDLELLQFFADASAIALDKAMLHRQLLEMELLDKQLQIARDAQLRLLPKEDPCVPGYEIAGICLPADEIGGDYYDYVTTKRGHLGIAVADVSGHGIASALAMTAFRGLLRTHANRNLSAASIGQMINQLLPDFTSDSHFITMSFGIINLEANDMTFVSCGHPPAVLIHANGRSEKLNKNGPALGIFNKVSYENETVSLSEGDILVMYTDGVVELENPTGETFGIDRLRNIIIKNKERSAKELIEQVIHETQKFTDFVTYLDDFTLVVIKKLRYIGNLN
jgi:phosphoserine phosphatase RsbU/P